MKLRILAFCLLALGLVCISQAPRAQLTTLNFGSASVPAGGTGSCAASIAYFARSATGFTSALDTFFCSTSAGLAQSSTFCTGGTLIGCGDAIYMLAQNTVADSKLNLISSTNYVLTLGGTLTNGSFTACPATPCGWTGNGTAGQYLDTNLNPTTATGLKMNAAGGVGQMGLFAWSLTTLGNGTTHKSIIGDALGSGNFTAVNADTTGFFYNCAANTGSTIATYSGVHFLGCTMGGISGTSTARAGCLNATCTGGTGTTVGFVNADFILMADSFGGTAARAWDTNLAFAFLGTVLGATDEANMCHAVYTYMNTVAGATGATC